MFLTKFVRKDHHPDEDFWYNNSEDALQHLSLFLNDDSDLYERIIVSDERKNTVLQILLFDADGRAVSFKKGDIVRFHHDFCTAGERDYLFAITNLNDRTMRATITCLNSSMAIPAAETVDLQMIVPVGTSLADILSELV